MMGRLIDEDVLLKAMDKRYKEKHGNVPDNLAEGFMQMEKLIKGQPTAYDSEKVVEQLEKNSVYLNIECDVQFVELKEATEIVRRGGAE